MKENRKSEKAKKPADFARDRENWVLLLDRRDSFGIRFSSRFSARALTPLIARVQHRKRLPDRYTGNVRVRGEKEKE